MIKTITCLFELNHRIKLNIKGKFQKKKIFNTLQIFKWINKNYKKNL